MSDITNLGRTIHKLVEKHFLQGIELKLTECAFYLWHSYQLLPHFSDSWFGAAFDAARVVCGWNPS